MKMIFRKFLLCIIVLIISLPNSYVNPNAQEAVKSIQDFASLQINTPLKDIYTNIGFPVTFNDSYAVYHVENDMKFKLYADEHGALTQASIISPCGTEMFIQFHRYSGQILYSTFIKQNIDLSLFDETHNMDEFKFIEIGTPVDVIHEQVGVPDYYTNSGVRNGVYMLDNGCRLHIENSGFYRVQHLRLQFNNNNGFFISFQSTPPRYLWEGQPEYEFSLASFSKLKQGMDMNEVYKLFGSPDKCIICGVIYNLGQGKSLVMFVQKATNTLKQLALRDTNGTYSFINITEKNVSIYSANVPIYLDTQTINHIQTTSPHSLKEFSKFKLGMTREQILEAVGEPNFYGGNMPGYYMYMLDDGNLIELAVDDGYLTGAKLSFQNRSSCILSFDKYDSIEIY